MKLKKELIKRTVVDETILVPCGTTVYDANGLYVLSELGAFLWDYLPKAETIDDLLAPVLAEYEVEEDAARADIEEFLDKLRSMDIL
ncbi:MAG: PqqD family protein [Clostridia bacterium]|nr:PqqD family protein [Clostridia bacterium]